MNFNIEKYEETLAKGLCSGLKNGERVCIEHAITLNDAPWSSPEARAQGLRDLGLAQLGSKGVVDGAQFTKLLAEKTIRILIPALFRELFPDSGMLLSAADRCEREGTPRAAYAAAYTARATARAADAYAADAACDAARAAAHAARATAARAAVRAAAVGGDRYLRLSARLAVEVLRELGSPGVVLLDGGAL